MDSWLLAAPWGQPLLVGAAGAGLLLVWGILLAVRPTQLGLTMPMGYVASMVFCIASYEALPMPWNIILWVVVGIVSQLIPLLVCMRVAQKERLTRAQERRRANALFQERVQTDLPIGRRASDVGLYGGTYYRGERRFKSGDGRAAG